MSAVCLKELTNLISILAVRAIPIKQLGWRWESLKDVFVFSVLNVGGVLAQEDSKTNCHQCNSGTLDAAPAARMSGEANHSHCKGIQIPHSTNKEKKALPKRTHFSTSFPTTREKKNCSAAYCSSLITALTKLLQLILALLADTTRNCNFSTKRCKNCLQTHRETDDLLNQPDFILIHGKTSHPPSVLSTLAREQRETAHTVKVRCKILS